MIGMNGRIHTAAPGGTVQLHLCEVSGKLRRELGVAAVAGEGWGWENLSVCDGYPVQSTPCTITQVSCALIRIVHYLKFSFNKG